MAFRGIRITYVWTHHRQHSTLNRSRHAIEDDLCSAVIWHATDRPIDRRTPCRGGCSDAFSQQLFKSKSSFLCQLRSCGEVRPVPISFAFCTYNKDEGTLCTATNIAWRIMVLNRIRERRLLEGTMVEVPHHSPMCVWAPTQPHLLQTMNCRLIHIDYETAKPFITASYTDILPPKKAQAHEPIDICTRKSGYYAFTDTARLTWSQCGYNIMLLQRATFQQLGLIGQMQILLNNFRPCEFLLQGQCVIFSLIIFTNNLDGVRKFVKEVL